MGRIRKEIAVEDAQGDSGIFLVVCIQKESYENKTMRRFRLVC